MRRQGKSWNHSQQMAGTRQTVKQAKTRCRMSMAAMVVLTTKMQMKMAMQ